MNIDELVSVRMTADGAKPSHLFSSLTTDILKRSDTNFQADNRSATAIGLSKTPTTSEQCPISVSTIAQSSSESSSHSIEENKSRETEASLPPPTISQTLLRQLCAGQNFPDRFCMSHPSSHTLPPEHLLFVNQQQPHHLRSRSHGDSRRPYILEDWGTRLTPPTPPFLTGISRRPHSVRWSNRTSSASPLQAMLQERALRWKQINSGDLS